MSARTSLAIRKNHSSKPSKRKGGSGITADEIKDVEELATPRTPVIYEVVRRLGEEEMERPLTSLWWSGLAAGLSISFSLLSQAILQAHLPESSWQPLVVSLGYCVGFIMAVLSRQQLFTESTITAVLPVAAEVTWVNIARMGRLWAIVLAANLGISEHVEFCGYCLNPYAFMARASVLVLSSLHEGFPNVLVEAMACGCPVVSTNCPVGPTEILEKGKYGTLVPVGDDTAMAHAIVDVLKHRPNASALKARAAAFSYEEAISRYEEALTGSTNVIPIRERRSARRAAGH